MSQVPVTDATANAVAPQADEVPEEIKRRVAGWQRRYLSQGDTPCDDCIRAGDFSEKPTFRDSDDQLRCERHRLKIEAATSAPETPLHGDLLARGFAIFPIWPNSKSPMTSTESNNGCTDASNDPDEVRRLWTGRKAMNVGVEAYRSGLLVVDVDNKGDRNGFPRWEELERLHGSVSTLTATTPSGGRHLYFRRPRGFSLLNNFKDDPTIGVGLEIKNHNAYVVAPGSTIDGKPYEFVDPAMEIAEAPAWLISLMAEAAAEKESKPAAASIPRPESTYRKTTAYNREDDSAYEGARRYAAKVAPASSGSRNKAAFSLAGHIWAFGISDAEVMGIMDEWNSRCSPPLDLNELEKTVRSARVNGTPRARKTSKQRGARVEDWSEREAKATANKQNDGLMVVDWNNVEEGVNWLWGNCIPLGGVTLFAGIGGLGKSTATIDFAAAITSGSSFPDGTPAPEGDVIMFSAEDANGPIKQRARQQGVNFNRFHKIEGQRVDGKTKYFDLSDLGVLQQALERWPSTKAIIIDPIASYVSGIDAHKNADVRRVMAPLTEFAEQHGISVILVIHLSKDEKKSADRAHGATCLAPFGSWSRIKAIRRETTDCSCMTKTTTDRCRWALGSPWRTGF
jgi:hypothetical protein